MAGEAANELLSTQKASDSGLQVVLHPLPILEISDFITRGYQRGFQGAVVGGLLGQQNGREITIEHSFSCKTAKNADGFYELDQEWFKKRLEQMRLVHKSPALDLVGWYSLVSKSGPAPLHLPIHRQITSYNESAVLLGFHIEDMLSPASGDPLPITIYESNMEAEDSREAEGEDKEMRDAEAPATMVLRFRKLPYTTDTGEAEMIAMQFIREGGASAALDGSEKHILDQFDKKIAVNEGKGKRRAVAYSESSQPKKDGPASSVPASASASVSPDQPAANPDANLTRAEAEYMAALQAKYSAVKMMKSRLALVIAYLQRLPPDFTAGKQTTAEAAEAARAAAAAAAAAGGASSSSSSSLSSPDGGGPYTIPSNTILRHIQALVTNADLVAPAEQATLEREIQRETNDVGLLTLVSDLVASVNDVREAGKKFHVLDSARHTRQGRMGGPAGSGAGGPHSGGSGGGGGGGSGPGGQFDPGLRAGGVGAGASAVADF